MQQIDVRKTHLMNGMEQNSGANQGGNLNIDYYEILKEHEKENNAKNSAKW